MFTYFMRLYQKHRRRILPIAVFSYDVLRDEPDSFQIGFPFLDVLRFDFYKVELRKRNWRDYIHSENPVAAALLSKMGYGAEEKVRVKSRIHADADADAIGFGKDDIINWFL